MNAPDIDRLQTWELFLRTYTALTERFEHELAEAVQLPLVWYDVLVQLHYSPNQRARPQELAQRVALTKSGMTRRLDRMAAAGLISRETCETDRRGVEIVLTPAGEAALREAAPVHLRGIQRHFARYLSPEESATIAATFQRILTGLDQSAPTPESV